MIIITSSWELYNCLYIKLALILNHPTMLTCRKTNEFNKPTEKF